jgi:hypothetical protein
MLRPDCERRGEQKEVLGPRRKTFRAVRFRMGKRKGKKNVTKARDLLGQSSLARIASRSTRPLYLASTEMSAGRFPDAERREGRW